MHFTRDVALVALFAGVQAFPSHFPNPFGVSKNVQQPYYPCFMICLPEQPRTCPESWTAENKGGNDNPCWTCCKVPPKDDDDLSLFQNTKSEHLHHMKDTSALMRASDDGDDEPGHCLAICYADKVPCPNGFDSRKFGQCNTCCLSNRNDLLKHNKGAEITMQLKVTATKNVAESKSKNAEICWKACFPEPVQCPPQGKSRAFGECNTCCFGIEEDALAMEL